MDDIDRATATAEVPEDEARDSKTLGEMIEEDIADPLYADNSGVPGGRARDSRSSFTLSGRPTRGCR